MQNLFFAALLGVAVWGKWSDEREALLAKARAHKDRYERVEAIKLYEQVLQKSLYHLEAASNVAVLSVVEAHWRKSPQLKQLVETSLASTQQLLKKHPDEAESHFSYAVVVGEKQQLTSSSSQRIRWGQQVYQHVKRAIELNPRHPESWGLLASWHFKMATLNAFEKMAVGDVAKPASLTEGLKAVEKAIELRPTNLKFYLLAARFCDELKQIPQRNGYLKNALSLKPLAFEDAQIQEDCRALLKK